MNDEASNRETMSLSTMLNIMIPLGIISALGGLIWAKLLDWWEATSRKETDLYENADDHIIHLLKELQERWNPLHRLIRQGRTNDLKTVLENALFFSKHLQKNLELNGFLKNLVSPNSTNIDECKSTLVNASIKENGMTLLMAAGYHGSLEIVKLLLQQPGIGVDWLDKKTNSTVLTWTSLGHFHSRCIDEPDELEEWNLALQKAETDKQSKLVWTSRWKELDQIYDLKTVGPQYRQHVEIIKLLLSRYPTVVRNDSSIRGLEYAILSHDTPLCKYLDEEILDTGNVDTTKRIAALKKTISVMK